MAEESSPDAPADVRAMSELRALARRAKGGDPKVLPRMREVLDDLPDVWKHMGDLSTVVETAWISVLAGKDPLAVESMKRTLAGMRRDLAGRSPSAVDKMLADQVVACWMEVKHLEAASADGGRATLAHAGFTLKRLESAQRRYLLALKALQDMRGFLPAEEAPPGTIKLYQGPGRERA